MWHGKGGDSLVTLRADRYTKFPKRKPTGFPHLHPICLHPLYTAKSSPLPVQGDHKWQTQFLGSHSECEGALRPLCHRHSSRQNPMHSRAGGRKCPFQGSVHQALGPWLPIVILAEESRTLLPNTQGWSPVACVCGPGTNCLQRAKLALHFLWARVPSPLSTPLWALLKDALHTQAMVSQCSFKEGPPSIPWSPSCPGISIPVGQLN